MTRYCTEYVGLVLSEGFGSLLWDRQNIRHADEAEDGKAINTSDAGLDDELVACRHYGMHSTPRNGVANEEVRGN
jgi:hypothetical protein